jgi:two-component system chemotaxis response regulator CheY
VKILIVDDDPASRRLLVANLTWAGHEVIEASDGEQGWAVFQREATRLVITDWMMPALDGTSLISRIRAAPAAGYTYVILLTALGDKPQVITGLEAGADDYLTKPFDPDELLARVATGERLLRHEARLAAAQRQAEQLAMRDALTGLLNRRAIEDQARAELNRLRRGTGAASLILLDLDHFKTINDTHGHAAGDEALRQVARLLEQQLRSYDQVGRWGGEEFLVLLPDASLEEACRVAERLRAGLAGLLISLDGSALVQVSASLGVATLTAERAQSVALEQLLDEADRALYCAKRDGRNRVSVLPAS